MDWQNLISPRRPGFEEWHKNPVTSKSEDRTQFQRDYDRIVFSPSFRRMQNKTQVFPLPDHIFVHNRLTHSLEVASVGRSLGNLLSEKLRSENPNPDLFSEIGTIVSAACLAHDMGNPPFGHSGEEAISSFFKTGAGKLFEFMITEPEWKDFIHFDGNANAFRILTHQFTGKRSGGFALTYSTLASIVKYPYESMLARKQKFGFFQSEKEIYSKIATELGLRSLNPDLVCFERHPLVFLVEAADDICYQIMDLEDAFKLGIFDFQCIKDLYLGFYDNETDRTTIERIEKTLNRISDNNERVSYLRAGVIGKLIYECIGTFIENIEEILEGRYTESLISGLKPPLSDAMEKIKKISVAEIYNHRNVIEIELAGFKIIGTLLNEFTGALFMKDSLYSKKLLSLIPEQYMSKNENPYHKLQSAVDFVSGMTDVYALDLYRKITGISLPGLK